MAWAILITAGLLEVGWSSALKKAEGLRRPGWSIAGISFAMISIGLLSLALRDLPVSTAYSVWVGIGAVGVAVTGILAFGDKPSVARLACMAAIIGGVVGLELIDS